MFVGPEECHLWAGKAAVLPSYLCSEHLLSVLYEGEKVASQT